MTSHDFKIQPSNTTYPNTAGSIVADATYYNGSTTTKKVTTTREYDQEGRVTKETVVEETTTYQNNYPYVWNTNPIIN